MLRESEISTDGNQLIFEGTVNFPKQGPGGVSFQGRIAISAPNGTLQAEDSSISVNDADMLTIVIDVRTNYKNDAYKSLCKETVVKAEKKTYEKLKKEIKLLENFYMVMDILLVHTFLSVT
jgi:alpha-L-fucosidase 2